MRRVGPFSLSPLFAGAIHCLRQPCLSTPPFSPFPLLSSPLAACLVLPSPQGFHTGASFRQMPALPRFPLLSSVVCDVFLSVILALALVPQCPALAPASSLHPARALSPISTLLRATLSSFPSPLPSCGKREKRSSLLHPPSLSFILVRCTRSLLCHPSPL